MKEILEAQLREIAQKTALEYNTLDDIGVLSGQSGIALFQFYCSKYFDDDRYSEKGVEIISNCIAKINEGYSYPTFCTGITGFGWTLQHLVTKDFIEVDCDELLSPFDDYLHKQMISDFGNGNFDFLHGALGYGFYFLSRYENTHNQALKNKYQSYLSELIAKLEKLSISDGLALKWESILDIRNGNKGYNLSLSHGISSILNFLSRLNEMDVFKGSTKTMLKGGANYILGFENKNKHNLSLFPSWIKKDAPVEYNSRLAWCYGDLGIGLSLYRAGKSLGDTEIQNEALKIMAHTTTRKLPEETMVNDAGLCHGSYGNALIYKSLYQKSGDEIYQHAFKFWIENGIEKVVYKDGNAAYKAWRPMKGEWTFELSLLEGIAGIGLVIIDYLSAEPNFWDECLMIS